MKKQKTILVTGAGGYVGNVLCRYLIEKDYKVRAVDNFHKGQCDALIGLTTIPEFEFMYGDVTDYEQCKRMVDGVDAVVHLAAIVGFPACKRQPALSYAVNVEGTCNLLDVRGDIPFVFASTGSVYGKIENICRENTPTNPQSIYGKHKLEAEIAVRDSANTVSFRFATGFGVSPCMRVNLLVNDLVYQAVTNRCLTVFEGNARRTFIHVKDMAHSFLMGFEGLFSETLNHNVYNVGSNRLNATKREIAELIKSKTGCVVNYEEFNKDPDARDYEVDYTTWRDEGFYAIYDIEKGVNELLRAASLLHIRHRFE